MTESVKVYLKSHPWVTGTIVEEAHDEEEEANNRVFVKWDQVSESSPPITRHQWINRRLLNIGEPPTPKVTTPALKGRDNASKGPIRVGDRVIGKKDSPWAGRTGTVLEVGLIEPEYPRTGVPVPGILVRLDYKGYKFWRPASHFTVVEDKSLQG